MIDPNLAKAALASPNLIISPDLHEELVASALDEEQEAPQYKGGPHTVPNNDPTNRRLRAIAGAGVPYLFLTFPADGTVTMDFAGMAPEELPRLLVSVVKAVQQ